MRLRRLAVVLAVAILGAACGGSLSDDEILAASGEPSWRDVGDVGPDGPGSTTSTTIGPDGSVTTEPRDIGGPGETPSATTPVTTPDGAPVGTPGETGPIVIASVGTYSGPAGASQAGMPRGVQTWAEDVNASGGLFGREVQVIVIDDGGDQARHGSAVHDLVENRGVVAFVGNSASLTLGGASVYLNEAGVPVIGNDCARADWWESAVFFPQCETFSDQIMTTMRAPALLTGQRRVGYVVCSEAAACADTARIMRDRAGDAGTEIVYGEQISLTQIDFTTQCRGARDAGVELLLVGADANTLLRFARSCERQGFFPQYIGIGTSTAASVVSQRGLEDIIVTSPVFPFQGLSGGVFDRYNRAMARYAGVEPGPSEALGWSSGVLFEHIATLAAAAARSITSETLLAAAHTVQGETLGGLTIPLDFTGTTPNAPTCYFVVQGDGEGGWGAPLGAEVQCA